MRFLGWIAPSIACLLLAGCRDQDVRVYRVAKESPAAPATPERAPAFVPSGSDIAWKTPSAWRTLPASGMRLASFSFEDKGGAMADISVVALPGPAGGELANVNRWRGQLGLESLDESGLASRSERIRSKAGVLLLVDLTGSDPKGEIPGKARMLGAILSGRDKQWFIKAMGGERTVAEAKPSFLEFLKSLKHAPGS